MHHELHHVHSTVIGYGYRETLRSLWLIISYRLAVRRTGKAKRTRQQQSADPDGYVATLLYPSYADFLFKEALVNSFIVIPAKARQKRLRVERPQGRPEGRAKRVIQSFQCTGCRPSPE